MLRLLFANLLCSLPFIATCAMNNTRWPRVLQAVKNAAHDANLTTKELCFFMGYDASEWSRIQAGEKALDLYRLALLPLNFQTAFIGHYAFAVVGAAASDIAADIKGR